MVYRSEVIIYKCGKDTDVQIQNTWNLFLKIKYHLLRQNRIYSPVCLLELLDFAGNQEQVIFGAPRSSVFYLHPAAGPMRPITVVSPANSMMELDPYIAVMGERGAEEGAQHSAVSDRQ